MRHTDKPQGLKGYTLVELSMVVAIVSVMAMTAGLRMGFQQEAAEASAAKNLTQQLRSGVAMYMTQTGRLPTNFRQFVTLNHDNLNVPRAGNRFYTVSLHHLGGMNNRDTCVINAARIQCGQLAFLKLSTANYDLTSEGLVTSNIRGESGKLYTN
ncbi:MAG: type II secretion system protein [Vampirovibrionales bacterium]